ncbi:S8 family serine peptidase [Halarchaeum sp. P4]|uniref:S8 family serine peptidase n=1 Tax=Halarchaeum sp. P4 TaxID=3421639 RepID=UPI003EBC694A
MNPRALAALVVAALVVGSVVAPAAATTSPTRTAPDVSSAPAPPLDALPGNVSNVTATPSGATSTAGTNVTLLTGQTVHVTSHNGTTRYYTDASTTTYTVRTPRGTYVVPAGVDFETFDPSLFNVDLLLAQGYDDANSTSLPLIVSDADGEAGPQRSTAGTATTDVLDSVAGVTTERRLGLIDAASTHVAKANAGTVAERLRADEDVGRVSLDVKYHVANADADRIVDGERAKRTYNVSGRNVTVAVIDSGIDQTHPDLNDTGKVVGEYDFVENDTDAQDRIGHGTHVAATIAGEGDVNRSQAGIAPNASLLDLRVFGTGGAPTSRVIAAVQHAVEDNRTDVISMSLGGPAYQLRSNDPYTEAINNATAAGIPVVVAAGNNGEYLSVGSPGIAENAITVGATDKHDAMAAFSSRGPTPRGHFLKPDVVAPGVNIVSANAFYEEGSAYVEMSGTSMATPVTSGVVALMLSKNAALTPGEVKSRLLSTADPLNATDAYTQGAGRINATDALEAASVTTSDDLGPDVVVSPGSTDFGQYTSNTTVTRTVTVANYGESNATLDVNASVTNVVNPEQGDASVSLNRSTLTLASGERAALAVTVQTGTVVGAYAGRLSFNASEATGVFGFARAYAVTIEKRPMESTNVTDDLALLFAENDSTFARTGPVAALDRMAFSGANVTRYVIANGTYNALSVGTEENTGEPIITSKEVVVNGSTTVTLDEGATVARSATVTNATTTNRHLRATAVERGAPWTSPYGDVDTYSMSHATGADGVGTVYVSPDADLTLRTTRLRSSTPGPGLGSPSLYYLQHSVTGIAGNATWNVSTADLVRTDLTYTRAEANTTYNVSFRDAYRRPLANGSLGGQLVQSVYRTPGSELRFAVRGTNGTWVTGTRAFGVANSGSTTERTVLRQPLVATWVRWNLSGGDGPVAVVPQATQDADGIDTTYADTANDTVTVWTNGTRVASYNTTAARVDGTVSVNESETVAVRTDARNDGFAQSSRTVATYNVTYAAETDNVPPQFLAVTPQRLDATSEAPNGSTVVTLTVADHSSLANASVLYATGGASTTPFDGNASGWQNAMVLDTTRDGALTRYAVALNTTGHVGNVSVAVNATDADGNAATLTTFDAFEVHDVPPEPRFRLNRSGPVEANVSYAYDGTASWDNLGIATQSWQFGDNTTASGSVVAHTYTALGNYTLNHTVVDTGGHAVSNETTVRVVDSAPTAALTVSSSSPVVGESVTLSATGSADPQGVTAYRWDVDGDGTVERTTNASTPSITHAYQSAATYQPTVTVVDTRDQRANATATVTVQAKTTTTTTTTTTTSSSGGGGFTGGGGGGGFVGGGGGGADATTTTTTTPTRNETTVSVNATTTVISTPVTNGTATVTLPNESAEGGVTVAGATISVTDTVSRLTVTVRAPNASAPRGTPALDAAAAVSYFGIETDAADADVRGATVRFTVEDRTLPSGTAPEDVTLYRYHGGTWTPLPTEHRGGGTYVASTPGFSTFAVGGTPTATTTQTVEPVTETTSTTVSTPTPTTTGTTSGGSPGFGVALALGATLAAFLLRRR